MKRLICIMLTAIAVICMTGCKHELIEDPTSSKYEGYWECNKVKMDGQVYEDYYIDPQIPISAVYALAIAGDGTGYLDSPLSKLEGKEDKQAFNWKEEDGQLRLYGESSTDVLTLTYTDGSLLMKTNDTTEIWFGKVDKLSVFDPSDIKPVTEGASE